MRWVYDKFGLKCHHPAPWWLIGLGQQTLCTVRCHTSNPNTVTWQMQLITSLVQFNIRLFQEFCMSGSYYVNCFFLVAGPFMWQSGKRRVASLALIERKQQRMTAWSLCIYSKLWRVGQKNYPCLKCDTSKLCRNMCSHFTTWMTDTVFHRLDATKDFQSGVQVTWKSYSGAADGCGVTDRRIGSLSGKYWAALGQGKLNARQREFDWLLAIKKMFEAATRKHSRTIWAIVNISPVEMTAGVPPC